VSLVGAAGELLLRAVLNPLFLVLVLVVAWQYKRMQRLSEGLFALERNIYVRSTVISTLAGVAGGAVGALVLIALGIDLSRIGIVYLFLTALTLMLFHPRYLCFAYAGGIVSLFSLLSGAGDIDVPQLRALVGVLHMVEALLILLTGWLDPMPVYVRREGEAEVVGGFNLQKFWPIPLVAVMGVAQVSGPGVEVSPLARPEWWPLLHLGPGSADSLAYMLVPVLAILGYGEVATTAPPRRKVVSSAGHLALFSAVLVLLALGAALVPSLVWVPALFGPLGHELLIWVGLRQESRGEAIYRHPGHGVMVLDVLPGSLAARAGIRSQDVVLAVNGMGVRDRLDLYYALQAASTRLDIDILRAHDIIYASLERRPRQVLGIIPVPEPGTDRFIVLRDDTFITRAARALQRLLP
jgi:hypothetical protein